MIINSAIMAVAPIFAGLVLLLESLTGFPSWSVDIYLVDIPRLIISPVTQIHYLFPFWIIPVVCVVFCVRFVRRDRARLAYVFSGWFVLCWIFNSHVQFLTWCIAG
jgi:hypothetical protein